MGFIEITCEEPGPIVIYLYGTELGNVTEPMVDTSYTLVQGEAFGDGYGLVPDEAGILRVEADWITLGTRCLAVAFKGLLGTFIGPKYVGITMVDGDSDWPVIKFNKTGHKGMLTQVVTLLGPLARPTPAAE